MKHQKFSWLDNKGIACPLWLCPQNFAHAINLGKKWWQIILEREISCNQWEGATCIHEWFNDLGFFFFLMGQGRGIFVFSLVPNVFPSSFQNVPKCVPQDIPNSTLVLSHMVCPQFNSNVYELKRWNKGNTFVSILQLVV